MPDAADCFRTAVLALLFAGLGGPAADAGAAAGKPARNDFAATDEVARIDGRAVTLGDLMLRFANLPFAARERYSTGGGLRAFLDDTVASIAIAEEGKAKGLERDPLFAALMQVKREEVLRDLHARRTVLAPVDTPALEKRYEQEKETRFRRPAVALVRHILVTPVAEARPIGTDADAVDEATARAKAGRLRAEIAGGADFAAVARRASEDTSGAAGGALGWVKAGQLVAEVDRLAFSLPSGQLSEVVQSRLGFHVVRVEERLPSGLLPFEAVRELLFQEMVGEQADALGLAARQDRERVLGRHRIEVHPERLP